MGRWRFTWRARPSGEERGKSNGFATQDPAGAKKRPLGCPWRHESAGVLPTLFIPRGAGRVASWVMSIPMAEANAGGVIRRQQNCGRDLVLHRSAGSSVTSRTPREGSRGDWVVASPTWLIEPN